MPVPFVPVREADVMWKKRIWRVIDLREKIKLPLYYPEAGDVDGLKSLSSLLWKAVTAEFVLKAYSLLYDDFSVEMTPEEVRSKVSKSDLVPVMSMLDPSLDSLNADGSRYLKQIVQEFSAGKVVKIALKEEWFFDRQRSLLDVRIIGVCPMYEMEDKTLGTMNLFWVYFPEARKLLAQYGVFNRQNPAERRSFDDIFWKRQFGSFITKKENVYNRSITEYEKGMAALLESNSIKEEIINFEHDLWEY